MLRFRPIALSFALLALLLSPSLPSTAGSFVGQKASEISLEPAGGGKSISLAQFKGKPVLVVFWATWCPPCRREIPALKDLKSKYGSQGLEIVSVGISYRQTRQAVKEFKEKNALPYEVLWDSDGAAAKEYQISSVPTNLLIDGDGVVRYRGNAIEPGLLAAIEKNLPKAKA